jgi:glycosyltransferase involved in cell wall biosynthesis
MDKSHPLYLTRRVLKLRENNQPKISIVIPVFNSEKYLDRCVQSILAQTFLDFECLLIDDCSSDSSPAICDKYAELDKRFTVIHNSVNQGSSLARQTGLDHSRGLYIQFIDSDDWVESDMLKTLFAAALTDNYDIVWADFYNYNQAYRMQDIEPQNKTGIYKAILNSESSVSSALWIKFIKREILSMVYFPPSMEWEDLVISIQIINFSKKILHLNRSFYHHIRTPNSISCSKERKNKNLIEIFDNLSTAINYLYEYTEHNLELLEPELSACVNRFKFESLFVKELQNGEVLFKFYPESNKEIFNKAWKTSFLKRLILFAGINKLPGIIIIINAINNIFIWLRY